MRSEADLAWEGIFFCILAHVFRFLCDFDGVGEPLGKLMGSFFRDFWDQKAGSNFKGNFERILESLGGNREPRLGLRLGKEESSTPSPPGGGGRIVYASRIPPRPLQACRLGCLDAWRVGSLRG